ncbi:MAG: MFS transporter [Gemmatimonadota bacterium]
MSTAPEPAVPRRVLPTIAGAQLAGTSLWFAVNAVLPDLQREAALPPTALGGLTSAIQLGFIAGTLVFALLTIADRFSPRRVFMLCAFLGAIFNGLAIGLAHSYAALLLLRFATGFFLAGIYPVGMKIAAAWYSRGLGAALGVLIGALVLGTAMPHGLRALGAAWPWQDVMLAVSLISAVGGAVLYWLVPDSPHLPRAARINPAALSAIWRDPKVRASAFGYFGHMWELYAVWALLPLIVATRIGPQFVSAAAFGIIAAGFIGCAGGGWLALRFGSARVAAVQLASSGLCCLLAPLLLEATLPLFWAWLAVWGITVVGDSPQFSSLTALNSPRDAVGSVLTFVNSIGFAITIVSIQVFAGAATSTPLAHLLPWLAIGPAIGLYAMRPLLREAPA